MPPFRTTSLARLAPASLYAPSHGPMPERLHEPDYPSGVIVRRVRTNGEIKWRGGAVQICSALALALALARERVAIEELERSWRVWFHQTPIATIDADTGKVSPIQPG